MFCQRFLLVFKYGPSDNHVLFDEAKVKLWAPYTDYAMSDVVKHKQFYYTANTKLKGTTEFDDNNWRRLEGKPAQTLYPNPGLDVECWISFSKSYSFSKVFKMGVGGMRA